MRGNRTTRGRTPGWHAGGSKSLYQPKNRVRVICDGVEERFPTEDEATARADELRAAGKRPVQCSH